MTDASVGYAIWNRRHKYDVAVQNILFDMDFALDSIIVPFVHHDLMHIVAHMADKTTHTHVVVYSSGTGIRKTYALDTEWHRHCSEHWLVSGHIMLKEDDDYPRLHQQAFAINLVLWKALSRPSIGHKDKGPLYLPAFVRSEENIHDDYTPLWLRIDGRQTIMTGSRGFGWNIIKTSFEHGIEVRNLPIAIRKQKFYIYPEDNSANLVKAVAAVRKDPLQRITGFANNSQQDFIDWLQDKLLHTKTPIFIFNTGVLWYESAHEPRPDGIWTTASGFKSFVEWYMRGASPHCSIHTYDYNEKSLEFWQHIHGNWSGNDLYSFLLTYDQNIEDEEQYCWGNKLAGETIQQSSDRQEAELVEYFGYRANMVKHWKRFQSLTHHYHNCNLITEHQTVIDQLSTDKSHYFWVNNIFFFRHNIIKYGLNHLNDSLCELTDKIHDKSPQSYMFGQCSKFYFGHRVGEISELIRSTTDHKHQWDLDNTA